MLNTELITTSLPPIDKCFTFHPINIFSNLSIIGLQVLHNLGLTPMGTSKKLNGKVAMEEGFCRHQERAIRIDPHNIALMIVDPQA